MNVKLLSQLIKYRENDMMMDLDSGQATRKEHECLTNLIIAITKYNLDIRYCSKKECRCSPEYDIKRYYDVTKHLIRKTGTALHPIPWKQIEDIIKGL